MPRQYNPNEYNTAPDISSESIRWVDVTQLAEKHVWAAAETFIAASRTFATAFDAMQRELEADGFDDDEAGTYLNQLKPNCVCDGLPEIQEILAVVLDAEPGESTDACAKVLKDWAAGVIGKKEASEAMK